MRRVLILFIAFVVVFALSACSNTPTVQCGPNTAYVDGKCVAADLVDEDPVDDPNEDPNDDDQSNDDQNNDDQNNDDQNNEEPVNIEPVIVLENVLYSIYVGDAYQLPTCTVIDDDTDLSCTVTGDTVDSNTVGVYRVLFSVTDSDGNYAERSYTLSVVEQNAQSGGSIRLKADRDLLFTVGEYFPMNLNEYFESDFGIVLPGNIVHNVLMSADYLLNDRGTYTVTVSIGGTSQDFTVNVIDPEMNPSDWVTSTDPGIYLNPTKELIFTVGDYMPNWADYFIGFDGTNILEIPVYNFQYTLVMDADQKMISEGFAQIEVTVGPYTETYTIVILGGNIDRSIFTNITELGLYQNFDMKQFNFSIGDRMPDFSSYYIGHDGDDFVILNPGMTLHDILLSDDNIMVQAGTYTVSIEVIIKGQVFTDSFTITVQ